MSDIPNSIEPVMRRNFLEYASYVIVDRAIPDLRDGCKPVQRRILHTLSEMDDGRFHKVANVIGETMKLHPHGDASIGDALVVLANKDYFIEKQGNFGNIITGHRAAAARYIECRLTPLARETLFNKHLTEFQPSYDGRKMEPVTLPAKLPVVLLLGTEGIAVGMSTRILPHNFCELLEAQIRHLQKLPFELLPDFPQGGLMDVSEYKQTGGKILVRARMKASKDKKKITITEIPFTTTTESLIASIETAAQRGKVQVASIEDRTAEEVEIVLHLRRGAYADEVIPQLFAQTHCQVAITPGIVVIDERKPLELGPEEILVRLTSRLKQQIKAELEFELAQLDDKHHALTLEQIFIENRVYKKIENAKTQKKVYTAVHTGMKPFADLFVRELTDDDVSRLLEIRIRRISAYDIAKNRAQIDDVVKAIASCKRKLRNLTKTTIAFLDGLLEKYGPLYPRRTEVTTFESVDIREVAAQNIRMAYDPDSSFFGSDIRGSEFVVNASEFDKILAVSSNGTYRIFSPTQKKLLPKKVLHIGVLDEKEGQTLTYIYRDKDKNPWAKKIHIKGFIHDKEYDLIKGGAGKIEKLWLGECQDRIHMLYVPAKFQRVHEGEFDMTGLKICGLGARGVRMAPKPVARFRVLR